MAGCDHPSQVRRPQHQLLRVGEDDPFPCFPFVDVSERFRESNCSRAYFLLNGEGYLGQALFGRGIVNACGIYPRTLYVFRDYKTNICALRGANSFRRGVGPRRKIWIRCPITPVFLPSSSRSGLARTACARVRFFVCALG